MTSSSRQRWARRAFRLADGGSVARRMEGSEPGSILISAEGPPPRHTRFNVLGIGVSSVTMDDALDTIDRWIAHREHRYVCLTGMHGVMESQRDDGLRRIHNEAGLVTPDGMPLVWLGRLHGCRIQRVYGPDLLLQVCARSVARGYRHFFYGGAGGVPQTLAANLRRRFPGLQVAGVFAPPFRPLTDGEDRHVLTLINSAAPDIVWIGLGTPTQERWMAAHVGRLTAPVLIGVGAAFDIHAGVKKQAPRWMRQSGFEWLFRLVQEPRRLWRRYVWNIPVFGCLLLLQAVGARRRPLS